jgi:cysteine synthase
MPTPHARRERLGSRPWAEDAVALLEGDANRTADTHLHVFPLPVEWRIDPYLKDESVHPDPSSTGSRVRSFSTGYCNGWITERTTISLDDAQALSRHCGPPSSSR